MLPLLKVIMTQLFGLAVGHCSSWPQGMVEWCRGGAVDVPWQGGATASVYQAEFLHHHSAFFLGHTARHCGLPTAVAKKCCLIQQFSLMKNRLSAKKRQLKNPHKKTGQPKSVPQDSIHSHDVFRFATLSYLVHPCAHTKALIGGCANLNCPAAP